MIIRHFQFALLDLYLNLSVGGAKYSGCMALLFQRGTSQLLITTSNAFGRERLEYISL
jgi:hypothetical protein